MKRRDKEPIERITIERARALYREPDVLAHYSNPDRNVDNESFCRRELAMLRDHVRDNGHVLVVGCAGGQESFAFLRAGYTVTGVDIVPEFIEAARRHAKEKGFENQARFEVVDGFEWPVDDASCDAVSMLANFLIYLPSRAMRTAVFTECMRVLKRGGVALMEDEDRTHPSLKMRRKPDWEPDRSEDAEKKAEWNLKDEPGAFVAPGHPCSGHKNAKTLVPRYLADPRELWAEVEESGLRVIRVQTEQSPTEEGASVVIVAVKD